MGMSICFSGIAGLILFQIVHILVPFLLKPILTLLNTYGPELPETITAPDSEVQLGSGLVVTIT